MAVKLYLHDIDLDNNRLLNARHHPLSTQERLDMALNLGSSDEGRLVYDISIKTFFYWNGSQWIEIAGDKNFVYTQTSPSDTWIVSHLLGKFPAVSIVDTAGDEVEGEINHIDYNTTEIRFSASFSGQAFFN